MSEHERGECDCCARKYAALRIAGMIDGIHMRQRDAYRNILQDLIAELRGYRHRARNDMADYYEQRLREVSDE